eukprot:Skav226458  [mRNA]  locus=scaffold1781:62187:62959:+ [translate_table: standard]
MSLRRTVEVLVAASIVLVHLNAQKVPECQGTMLSCEQELQMRMLKLKKILAQPQTPAQALSTPVQKEAPALTGEG